MEQTETGLINRNLIVTINERSRDGGQLTLLFVRLHDLRGAEPLEAWLQSCADCLWRQRFGQDCYGLFSRSGGTEPRVFGGNDAPPQLESARLTEAARDTLGRDAAQALIVAVPLRAAAGQTETEVEAAIYQAIMEAQWSARSGRRASRSPQPRQTISRSAGSEPSGDPAAGAERALSAAAATIGELAVAISSFPRGTEVAEIARLMAQDAKVHNVVIVDGERPVGLVMKEKLNQLLAGQYGMPLYWRRPISRIMDQELLVVDCEMSVEQASQLAMARDDAKLYDVVVITREDRLLGAASIRSMLEAVTSRRTEAARVANPLTGLPGNEGIRRELLRMLERGQPLSIIYADLDYFKWFNDTFGFRQGDELIRYTGELLQQADGPHAGRYRFVGHIGGDDFIVLTDDPQAQLWCHELLRRFDREVRAFYGDAEVTQVSDRHGHALAREGVTLSLSLMEWDGRTAATPESVSTLSAKLKKRAKSVPGSICVAVQITEQMRREEVR